MKLLLINFSDIHLVTGTNAVLDKKEKILDVIKNQTLEFDEVILLISGDSTYSGLEAEFDIAINLLDEITDFIKKYSKKNVRVITIPGNHDCNFLSDTKARKNQVELVQKLGESAIDETVITQLTNIQLNYRNYDEYFEDKNSVLFKNDLLTVYKFDFNEYDIAFYCYNSAYISEIHEQPGKMFFPLNQLPNIFSDLKADLFISVFHHPLNWYSPLNRREFETHIHETSDFYITGHEHEPSSQSISDLPNNIVYHLEGSVLQESNDPERSEFNFISFDLTKKEFLYNTAVWSEGAYHIQNGKPWTSYIRGLLKIKNKYQVNQLFERILNDVGGKFTHPEKSDIKLDDVYIFPKLKQFISKKNSEDSVPFIFEDAESIIKNLSGDDKLMILGNENIGKTSILKTTFKILNQKGMVPIFIKGETLKNFAIDELIKVVQKNFIDIYGSDNLNDFTQENIENIYIIIDDIDKSPLKNKRAKARLIENLCKYYRNLIISGNELFPVEEILTDEVISGDLYSQFKQYEILEFNHSYRNKLIQRWYSLGVSDYQNEETIWKKCDEANRAINIAMGNKIVPNYPIFILILLQALESTTGHNLQLSSYGNYYQLLILKSFSEHIKDQADLTMYQNYCAELANYFFDKKTKIITLLQFTQFHKETTSYEKFDLPFLTYEKAKDTLSTIGVLDEFNDQISFKYQYIYYFFQAKYLAQNISKEEIKDQISSLCKRLYRTEFANIIMFLIHFSKEEFILDELLSNTKGIFQELQPCFLENDIKDIQTLLEDLPKIYLQDRSIEDVRREEDNSIDKQEEGKSQAEPLDNDFADLNEDISQLDIVSKLNLGFKLIEILGQILKNNYGAMQGPVKYNLLKETYLLGLRSLNSFYYLIQGNTELMINQMKSMISENEIETNEESAEKKARHILFSMCSQISYLFIKKLSDGIGTYKLVDKYQLIEDEFDHISVKLTNYQIKLDQGTGFPNKELPTLKKNVEQYPLSYFVLKQMVISHLHRNPVDFKDKQRICEFLEIPIQQQLKYSHKRKKDAADD